MTRYWLSLPNRFLLPAFVLCVLSSGLGRAQNSGVARASSPGAPNAAITVQVDGQSLAIRVPEGTVADALRTAGVQMGEQDECTPSPSESARPGTTIVVRRIVTSTYTRTETIPAQTQVRSTRRLRRGHTMISQHPKPGLKEVTYTVTLRDGEVAKRQVTGTKVVRAPKHKILLVGGKETQLASRGGYFGGRRTMNMVATGYPAMVTGTGRTYLGLRARKGIVAVDPRVIPLGSRLYVQGYGEAYAGDIGGAIKGNRIDLCFRTFGEADRYGKKRVKVWILSD